jgi:AcrR family transcriptional regulator
MSPRASSREALIDAAEAVVVEKGAAHLTLDAVSARARVSKGGLLYHFPSKESLLQAMVDRMIAVIRSAREAEAARLPDSPARLLKAHIRTMLLSVKDRLAGTATALLAAGAENPGLLRPIGKVRARSIEELRAPGMSAAFVESICLALDGFWDHALPGMTRHNRRERQAILDELLMRVEQEEARRKGPGAPPHRDRSPAR